MVTKQQLANGLSSYLLSEISDKISDISTKILIGTLAFELKVNSKIIDNLSEISIVKTILNEHDGKYEISHAIDALSESIKRYGNLVIVLPSIPLISKEEKTISLSSEDISILKDYIDNYGDRGV